MVGIEHDWDGHGGCAPGCRTCRIQELEAAQARIAQEQVPPLTAYMSAETTPQRDAAFLRMYAAKVRDRTAAAWEIPNSVASTLEDIAKRIDAAEAAQARLREEAGLLQVALDLERQHSARLRDELAQLAARDGDRLRLRDALEHLQRVHQAGDDDTAPPSEWRACHVCGTEVGWPVGIFADDWPAEPICEGCVLKAALSASAPAAPHPQEQE
jgi:hypothetical protein